MPPKHKRPKVVGESSRASKRIRTRRKGPPPVEEPPLITPPDDEPVEPPLIDAPTHEQPVEDPPFSSPRFVCPAAQTRYIDGFSKKPVLCERGIVLEQFESPPLDLMPLISAKGWQKWVKFQHKAFIPLVKEFYSNVAASRDDSGNRCLKTEVRKVKIELRPSDIAEMFQIPREAPPGSQDESDVDLGKENLAKVLTGKDDAVWLGPTLPKVSMTQKCNILHRLLCSHFMPHAFTGSISIKQATFLGRMMLGVHIDLAKHILTLLT